MPSPPKPMKIGILTFHRCANYGAYWQARCLLEALRGRGHDAVILDHHAWRAGLMEWNCGLNPELPVRSPWRHYPAYARKLRAFRRARAGLPRSRPIRLHRPGALPEFDRIVVGSDEVWNLKHPWYGRAPLFFGVGLGDLPRISYAASFGNHPAAERLPAELAGALRRFEAISVRDANSRQIVREAVGTEPEQVLDPCLLVPPGPVAAADADDERGRGPYAVVYGFGFTPAFVAATRRWAAAAGVRLVSVGYHNPWADANRLSAGPADFDRLMRGATAVATNYFHGCVFALRYARPFACEARPYRAIKIADLLETVGARAHRATPDRPAEEAVARLGEPLDPAILGRIEALRAASAAYLDRAVGAAS